MSLVHKYVYLIEPYYQEIKVKVTTKNLLKEKTVHNISTEGLFQIQSPICGVKFSNNILTSQVKIKEKETELDLTFETFNL